MNRKHIVIAAAVTLICILAAGCSDTAQASNTPIKKLYSDYRGEMETIACYYDSDTQTIIYTFDNYNGGGISTESIWSMDNQSRETFCNKYHIRL